MRKFILLGATGLLIALGATGANAQSILNRPSSSPYAVLNQTAAAPALAEGRSAYIGGNADTLTQPRGPLKNSGPATQPGALDLR